MDSEWPPAPPDGYQKHNPEYVQPWFVTAFLYVWIVGVFVGTLALVIGVHGPDTVVRIVREVLQPDTTREWAAYIVWFIGTFAVLLVGHEALHALAGRWFGLRTQFQFEYRNPLSWQPEILTYGEFQSRGESLAITLAPLVILTPVSIAALAVGQNLWVIAAAAVIALGNAASAVGDIASAWVLWNLPDGELLYHDSDGQRQYYTLTSE
jgi:energy-converting hydrogenase Eha subunit E